MEIEMEMLQHMSAKDRSEKVKEYGRQTRQTVVSTSTVAAVAGQALCGVFDQRHARMVFLSFGWQTTITIVVLLDIASLFTEQALDYKVKKECSGVEESEECRARSERKHWRKMFHAWWIFVTCIYVYDITMRIVAYGCYIFFKRTLCIIDFVLTVITAIDNIFLLIVVNKDNVLEGIAVLRLFRFFRLLRLLLNVRHVLTGRCLKSARYGVSGNRHRYVDIKENFDLDLSYITPRIIAMSVPAKHWLHWWNRNDLYEVVRFFEKYHAGKYLIVNCCPEMPYPATAFRTGETTKFDIQDHTPPSMEQFLSFLEITGDWMTRDPENTLVVHCKGGKGRTGSFIVAWLLYNRECVSLEDGLNMFALGRTNLKRTGTLQTVDTPSQVRYLDQLNQLLKNQKAYSPSHIRLDPASIAILRSIRFEGVFKSIPPQRMVVGIHRFSKGSDCEVIYWSPAFSSEENGPIEVGLMDTEIRGDMRISLFDEAELLRARAKVEGPAFHGDLCNDCASSSDATSKGGTVNLLGEVNQPRKDMSTGSDTSWTKRSNVKQYVAGKEPGCLFYFLLHSAFLENTSEGKQCGDDGSGIFKVTICPTVDSHGMDRAWRKPSKYYSEGSVLLRYANSEKPTSLRSPSLGVRW